MRKSLGLVSALALIGGLTAGIGAFHGPMVTSMSRMLTTAAHAAVEHPTAINGSVNNYAAVAPTYLGSPAGVSYTSIRLYSGVGAAGSTTKSTFSITIVGIPSGQTYGTPYTVAVPHMASIQLNLKELVESAGVGYTAFANGDTGYAVYLQDPDPEAGYQDVTYNGATNLFENMSNCATSLNDQMSALHSEMVLVNLETAGGPNHIGANFPSTVVIHNYYNVATTFTMSVFNSGGIGFDTTNMMYTPTTANSGKLTCQIPVTVPANSTVSIPESQIEANPSCRLDADEDNMNVVIANQSGGPPNALLTQLIHVSAYGGDTNMTDICAVNSVATPSGAGGGGVIVSSPYL